MNYILNITTFIVLFIIRINLVYGQTDAAININPEICIQAALDYSPVLKEGKALLEVKNTEIYRSKSSQYPFVSANTSYDLTNQNKLNENYNSARYSLNTSQIIWQFGSEKALVEQSEFLYQAELSKYNTLQQDLILQIKVYYFEYLKNINLLEIAESNLEQTEVFLCAAKEKKTIGIGKNSEILKAESDVANAKFIISTYKNNTLKLRNDLMKITGLVINENTLVQDELFVPDNKYYRVSYDSLFSIAKNNYPELKMIDDLILSQKAYTKSQKADMFPKISAGAGYNWSYNPLYESNDFWNAGLTVSWDIFSGFKNKYHLKIEYLQSDALTSQKENLLLNISTEIKNQYLTFNEYYNQIEIIETLLQSTSENLDAVHEEYKQGSSSMLELANARLENYSAKEKNINAWYSYQISKFQLERMIGVTYK